MSNNTSRGDAPNSSGASSTPVERAKPLAAIEQTLRRCRLCSGLSADELRSLAAAVRPVSFRAGEIVCRQQQAGGSMFIVARGRVRVSVEESDRGFRLLDHLGRGEHFGEMAMLTGHPRLATATAVVDTELLQLDLAHFQRLLGTVPAFGANLSRELGFRLQRVTSGRRQRWQPKLVGVVNSSPRTRALLRPLADVLMAAGESLEVLTDRPDPWPAERRYLVERVPDGPTAAVKSVAILERVTQVAEHHQRVFLDLAFAGYEDRLPQILEPCEQIWWLVETRYASAALDHLRETLRAAPGLAERVHLVWVLAADERYAPLPPDDLHVAVPDFKVVLSDAGEAVTRHERHSLLRLVRHLRGTRIGLALSGGGARGLAHLGVLRAFEREDIGFDMLAGTSSGALFGLSYAGGWDADFAIENFQRVLTPPRPFRVMPGGRSWYLFSKFRTGAWDRMLRPYVGQGRIEQLRIPFCTVAVDLVSGRQVVRASGDAIHAVLESINLPFLSRPILRDGMALVDGGIFNTLPADVLIERGAELVIGVDVSWKVAPRFAGSDATTPTHRMRRPNLLETFLRVNEVQDAGISALRAHHVDLMITPDASAFEFGDFSKAHELSDLGEAAAREAMPQVKQLLAEL